MSIVSVPNAHLRRRLLERESEGTSPSSKQRRRTLLCGSRMADRRLINATNSYRYRCLFVVVTISSGV